jgi:GNAT superfamily N-acetyltransferase
MKDLDWLTQWVNKQEKFPECLRPQDLKRCREQRLSFLRSGQKLTVVGQETSFLAWDTSAIEQDTQTPIALLWGRHGALNCLEQLLCDSDQKLAGRPLVVSAFVHQTAWMELLQSQGFYALRHFVTKDMRPQSVDPAYLLRPGKESDRATLSALALSVCVHTLPPHQESELGRYRRSLLQTLLKLDYGPKSEYELLIAEDKQGESLGYLLLRCDAHKTAAVVDIGVDKSHWGEGVAQFLVLSAENHLIERGFEFYVGEISAANRRSFYVATEICGFSPNRQLWRRDP